MKKLVLSATLLLSVASFAQKDELKTLKKIYAKETISEKDLEAYRTANASLKNLATIEEDKIYADFYSGMLPIIELESLGSKITPADHLRLISKSNLDAFSSSILRRVLKYREGQSWAVYHNSSQSLLISFSSSLT